MFQQLFEYIVGSIRLLFSYNWIDWYIVLVAPLVLSVLYFFIKFIAKRA